MKSMRVFSCFFSLFVSRRTILRDFSFWFWSFDIISGTFFGTFGLQITGDAKILLVAWSEIKKLPSRRIEHVWAARTVSRTARSRFFAFWTSELIDSSPLTTKSPATDSTSCFTLESSFNWCWNLLDCLSWNFILPEVGQSSPSDFSSYSISSCHYIPLQ